MIRPSEAFLLVAVLASGCQSAPMANDDLLSGSEGIVVDVPSVPFPLPIGGSARTSTGTVELTMSAVLEDSRCPSDVECVWEGRARVLVRVEGATAAPTNVVLTRPGTTSDPASAIVGSYLVTFHSLEPYPVSTAAIDPDEYRATLSVEPAP